MESRGHYQPLVPLPGQLSFRLLSLKSGRFEDEIFCELHLATLSQVEQDDGQPIYDAVSHAWGPSLPTYSIHLDAWSVTVRKALYQFLKHIRSPTEDLVLWIDALCIDQSNLSERGRQVQIMDKIYKSARRSYVWLGPGDPESSMAMNSIQHISDSPAKASTRSESEHAALLAWSNLSYWTRTWVVQEFLLARDVLIVCGVARLGWSTLLKFLRCISGSVPVEWTMFFGSPAYHLMRQRVILYAPRLPLQRLLIENRYTECQIPHDHVYAMLGLSEEHARGHQIQPDYQKSLRRLVLEVLDHCRLSPKEIPRHVKFLSTLLLPGDALQEIRKPIYPSETRRTGTWDVVGFQIGHVIAIATSLSCHHRGKPDCIQNKPKFGGIDIYDALSRSTTLDGLNMDRLQSFLDLVRSSRVGSRGPKSPASPDVQNYVAILTSNCTQPELLVGRAVGHVQLNDTVVNFLGHERGIILSANKDLTGCFVCARPSENEKTKDCVTREECPYWTVQTEAEIEENDRILHCYLQPSEVLEFGFPSRILTHEDNSTNSSLAGE